MANQYISNFTQLWNSAGTTYNAIKVNVTNSASAALSKLIDLQISAVSMFNVSKTGVAHAAGGFSLPSAGVIGWNSNAVTLTHAANAMSLTGVASFTVQYTDAGAALGPDYILERISSSAAVADLLGSITWRGRDSAANVQDYAQMVAVIDDPTSTTEDASLILRTVLAGTMTEALRIGVGQIKFPATQNPSSDVNTFDDYEEGTYTPLMQGSTSSGSGTYSIQEGHYIKLAGLCWFTWSATWSAHTGTGSIRCAALPFTSAAFNQAVSITASSLGYAAGSTLTARVLGTSTQVQPVETAPSATIASVNFDTAATIDIGGCYAVA